MTRGFYRTYIEMRTMVTNAALAEVMASGVVLNNHLGTVRTSERILTRYDRLSISSHDCFTIAVRHRNTCNGIGLFAPWDPRVSLCTTKGALPLH